MVLLPPLADTHQCGTPTGVSRSRRRFSLHHESIERSSGAILDVTRPCLHVLAAIVRPIGWYVTRSGRCFAGSGGVMSLSFDALAAQFDDQRGLPANALRHLVAFIEEV